MVHKKLALSIVYKQNQISLAGGQLGRLQIINVVKMALVIIMLRVVLMVELTIVVVTQMFRIKMTVILISMTE